VIARGGGEPSLLAVSDLHVGYRENRRHADLLQPGHEDDWLIVAGDIAEQFDLIVATLAFLAGRFARVLWTPGNHELWTHPSDEDTSRGQERYDRLVEACRSIGVLTPEDPYPVWDSAGGPVVVAPLFLLYDYSWLAPGTTNREESLAYAYATGIVCTDERFLHADPWPSRHAWCEARVELTRARLDAVDPQLPTVLVNHFPLVREPTRILRYPEFAQWCGTEATSDWHVRYRAAAVVYGHLHIPRTTWHDGVRFEEVSVGYPREWRPRGGPPGVRRILPAPPA